MKISSNYREAVERETCVKTLRLDELLSSERGGEIVNVYYCINCFLILLYDSRPFDPQIIIFSAKGFCPDCGKSLDEALRCEVYRGGTGRFLDARLEHTLFQGEPGLLDWSLGKVEDFPGENSGKCFRQEMSVGALVLYSGRLSGRQVHFESISTAAKGESVVFLDGGNSFNVFHLRDAIEHFSLKAQESDLMDRILISRAFNFHQFTNLVVHKLPEALDSFHPSLVIASEPTILYEEEAVIDKKEAWLSFKKMAWTLRRLTRTMGFRTIVNVAGPGTQASSILRDIADETVQTTEKGLVAKDPLSSLPLSRTLLDPAGSF